MADALDGLRRDLADRYAIEREIGAGGMATVYLAADLKHPRKVAIKVLRPEVAAVVGAERFVQEIRVTASLQHPHILALIDSGIVEGERGPLPYYVMPYVDGESLREKLERETQLPVEEALTITGAVAGALDYAHRHGVIHRDIKPENILLNEGHPLVADFGIALALQSAGGTRLTDTGLALGTPQYMSPEQGLGQREIGPRSDVYALGCVVYEMLAGEPPFTGPTAQAIIAKATRDTPSPLRAGRPAVIASVDLAVRRALEKLPADRFPTAGDFAEALTRPSSVPIVEQDPDDPKRTRRLEGGLAFLAEVLAVLAFWGWLRPTASLLRPATKRFELLLPPDVPAREILGSRIALAPDGRSVAYVGITDGVRRLFIRWLDETTQRPLVGTEGASVPFYSWDSKWLGFVAGGIMKKIAIAGGAVVAIGPVFGAVEGASWGEKGTIVYTSITHKGLWQIQAEGGSPQLVVPPDSTPGKSEVMSPAFLPGGTSVVVTFDRNNDYQNRVIGLETRKQITLSSGFGAVYAGADRLVDVGPNGLRVTDLDRRNMRLLGTPSPLHINPNQTLDRREFAVSQEGTLVYVPKASENTRLMLVDRRGVSRSLVPDTANYGAPRFSPSGEEIAVGVNSGTGSEDLWLYRVTGNVFSRLTFNGAAGSAAWSRDGRSVAYWRRGVGICLVRRDRPGDDRVLLPSTTWFIPDSWAPDGRWLYANEQDGHVTLIPVDSGLQPRRLWERDAFVLHTTISPDGHWLAYTSNDSGQWEVFVDALVGGAGRAQVSRGGGLMPVWNRNGKELFYRSGNQLYAATVTAGVDFTVTDRRMLFESPALRSPHIERDYDVSPDGQHFVMLQRAEPLEKLVVVLNWAEELRPDK